MGLLLIILCSLLLLCFVGILLSNKVIKYIDKRLITEKDQISLAKYSVNAESPANDNEKNERFDDHDLDRIKANDDIINLNKNIILLIDKVTKALDALSEKETLENTLSPNLVEMVEVKNQPSYNVISNENGLEQQELSVENQPINYITSNENKLERQELFVVGSKEIAAGYLEIPEVVTKLPDQVIRDSSRQPDPENHPSKGPKLPPK